MAEAPQVRCPHCDSRIDYEELYAETGEHADATCPSCHNIVPDPSVLQVERRYRLTDVGAEEAAGWQAQQARRPRIRVVLLCAIQDELNQVRRQMEIHGEIGLVSGADGAVYLEGSFAGLHVDWQIRAAATSQTNAAAAAATVGAAMDYQPAMIIFVGIAGSLKQSVALGDIVVADRVHDYEVGKAAEEYQERHLQHQSSFQLTRWAEAVATTDSWQEKICVYDPGLMSGPKVHVAPIAAGSKVVANKDSHTFGLIGRAAPRAVAVEMEGAGVLLGVHRMGNTEGLVVRGISDEVEGKEESDEEGWRHQAAANAVAFVYELLYQYQPSPQRD